MSKVMEVRLSAENIKGIITDHRAAELRFLTTLKGPAGADIEVVLPFDAQVEAAASVAGQQVRIAMFPPTRVVAESQGRVTS